MYNGLYDRAFHNVKMKREDLRRRREPKGMDWRAADSACRDTPHPRPTSPGISHAFPKSLVRLPSKVHTVSAYLASGQSVPAAASASASSPASKTAAMAPAVRPPDPTTQSSGPASSGNDALADLISLKNYVTEGAIGCLHMISDLDLVHSIILGRFSFQQRLQALGYLMGRKHFKKIAICESEHKISLQDFDLGENAPECAQKAYASRRRGLFGLKSEYVEIHENVEMSKVETLLAILQGCQRRLCAVCPFSKNAIYRYINEGLKDIEPCSELSLAAESVILSIRVCRSFTFKMFLSIYLKIEHAYLGREFLNIFMNGDMPGMREEERKCLTMAKARELFKLFKRSLDFKALKKSLQMLEGRRSRAFRSARAKVYFYLEDYYSAMETGRGTLMEYIAVALINPKEAVLRLQQALGLDPSGPTRCPPASISEREASGLKRLDLNKIGRGSVEIPLFLLLASILVEMALSPIDVCKKALHAFPGSLDIHLEVLRFLKAENPQIAYSHGIWLYQELTKSELVDDTADLIIFEVYILTRMLGPGYMRFLYNIRKKRNIPLYTQEIAYFEHKGIGQLGSMCAVPVGLFLFKEVMRRDCNKDGCCSACRVRYADFASHIYRFRSNGDFIILHYFIFGDPGVKRIADHLDPEDGFYWPRLRIVPSFGEKMKRGIRLAQQDFCNLQSVMSRQIRM